MSGHGHTHSRIVWNIGSLPTVIIFVWKRCVNLNDINLTGISTIRLFLKIIIMTGIYIIQYDTLKMIAYIIIINIYYSDLSNKTQPLQQGN